MFLDDTRSYIPDTQGLTAQSCLYGVIQNTCPYYIHKGYEGWDTYIWRQKARNLDGPKKNLLASTFSGFQKKKTIQRKKYEFRGQSR